MSQKLLLKWNNHMNVMTEFKNFLTTGIMIDVTLACDGQSLKAHKIVLSAFSSFFRSLFLENPCKHPIVILKDVKYVELKAIIDLMYCGEVSVEANQVSSLVKTAKALKVNGLGDVDTEDDLLTYESTYPSDDEFEYLSDNESINESVLTLDVHNGSFQDEQQMMDQNDNKDSTPDIVILETPKVKEVLSESEKLSVPCSSAEIMPSQSHKTCSLKSKNNMPNEKGQALTTKSLPRPQSSVQSNMKMNKNHSDNMSNVISVSSTLISPENCTNTMPRLVSIASTCVPPGQSFQSSAQSSIDQNKIESHNIPHSVLVKTACLSPEQLFQSPTLSVVELNKNPSLNIPCSTTVTATHQSKWQSILSSSKSNMELDKNQPYNFPPSLSVTTTHLPQGQLFQSSPLTNIELNKNHMLNTPSSSSVTSTLESKGQSVQSSVPSDMKLNKVQLHNTPHSLSVTTACLSKEQLFQSSALSNIELNKNHSLNIPCSTSVTSTLQTKEQSILCSLKSNMELNKNQQRNFSPSLSITTTRLPQGQLFQSSSPSNIELNKNQSLNTSSSPSVTSRNESKGQSIQSSAQSKSQDHSCIMPGLFSVTSTNESKGQSIQSSAQSKNQDHSYSMPGLFSVTSMCVSQRQSAQSNKQQHQNGSLPLTSTCLSQKQSFQSSTQSSIEHQNQSRHHNHSDDTLGSVSVTLTHMPSKAAAVDNQQSSTSSASGKKLKRKMKLRKVPSRISLDALQKMETNKVSEPHNLRKPEVLIIIPIPESPPQLNKELDQNHSNNSSALVSEASTLVPIDAIVTDNQQPSTSSTSSKRPTKKSVHDEPLQKKEKIEKTSSQKPVKQLRSSRTPEMLIINDSTSIKGHDKNKDSKSASKEMKFYECKICPFKTVCAKNLRSHINFRHHKKRKLKCDQCAYVTYAKSKVERHSAVHETERPYHCSLCTYKFNRKANLNVHVKKIHKLDRLIFKCQKCNFIATTQERIQKHEIEVHEKIPTVVINKLSEVSDMLPEVTDTLPEVTDVLPEVTDTLPEVTEVLPDVIDKLPGEM